MAGGARVIEELRAGFERRFRTPPEAGATAPGRVNLIGEHTDYNEGLVLPCAVDLHTVALVARRADGQVRAFSREMEGDPVAEFEAARPERVGGWVDYVQGVVSALRERGIETGGFELGIASTVPPGSGLSSSAALELAVVTALDALLGLGLDATERARVAHRAESGFAGVVCGIMDQYASALGREDALLRLDCRSEDIEPVPFPSAQLRLLAAHSGARELAAVGYAERVAECRSALEAARAAGIAPADARSLRDLTPAELPALEGVLEPLLLRRARHVVTENARVDAACAALRAGELTEVGRLLREGMASLRDDYEVSTPQLDLLCEAADAMPGVLGSRLTGAGWGGCTLHLVEAGAAARVAAALADAFARRFGRQPPVWELTPAAGATRL